MSVDWSKPLQHRCGGRVEFEEFYPDDHPVYPGMVRIFRLDEPQPMAATWWVSRDGVAAGWPGGECDIINAMEAPTCSP